MEVSGWMYGIGRINATDVMKTTADDRVKLNELNSARFPTILAAVAVAVAVAV
ncbi:hypothetical protein WUBG_12933 [Wuchereria bancrofti]|uniref:Uncharacterized protein n=1 Tax=Wuchereria bancrofti TaxID=6293 RepID=J9ELF0_WUCBA|nr:hypothetical protein WUBG_12933 [Wuchereria bancrofti]